MRRSNPRRSPDSKPHVERLEGRQLLAAHILGSPTVYATIQAAVDAAAPHATITVDPGNYPELVGINKTLTIRGAQAGVDARSAARDAAAPAGESVVSGESVGSNTSSGFYVTANDVTIDGFTVQGNTSAGMYGAGIVIAPNIAGTHVVNNVLQNNIAGLYLSNSSASNAALIQYNVFRNNNNAGANGGRGIYTDPSITGGNLTNVTIDSNFFLNNYGGAGTTGLEAAIGLESLTANAQSNIRITNNVMEGNGKAVLAYNATGLTITGNTVTTIRDQWSGALRFEGGVSNVTITGNNLYANTGPAVRIDKKTIPLASSGFVVTGNDFYGNSSAYGSPAAAFIVLGSGAYTGTLDARNNWWGNAGGPSGDLSGGGDGLFMNGNSVQYSPWATTAPVARDTAFTGLPATASVPVQAENFNQGGNGFAYASARSTNPAGWVYRNTGIGVTASADIDGGYNVGSTVAGQWMDYTIDVAQAGTYRVDLRLASGQTTGGTFHLNLDGVNITGTLSAPNTGGWQSYQTVSSATFSVSAGRHVVRLVMDGAGSGGAVANFNWLQLSASNLPSVPSNLALVAASGTELDLSWTQGGNPVDHFTIFRQTGAGAFVQLAQLAGNATSYKDAGLAPNTSYAYKIVASNSAGDSLPAGPIGAVTPVPPGAPTNLHATNVTATSLTLAWTAPANVTGYQITRQGPTGGAQVVATLGSGATSFADSGLAAGTAYQYVVTASNAGGIGGGSTLVTATAPLAPSGLVASASQNQITLNWTGSAGATGYNVYRGTAGGAESATPVAANVQGTSFVDPGLASGTRYYYVVTAVDAGGESARSGEATARIAETIPPAPTGLTAGANQNQITLSWSAAAGVTSYRVYRGATPGGEDATPIATGVNGTNYTDDGLPAGATFFYTVSAVNGAGEGLKSAETSALVPYDAPDAPLGVSAIASGTTMNLTWLPSAHATSYTIYRGLSPNHEFPYPYLTGVTGTSYLDTGLTPGVTYFYVVSAVNSSGEGPVGNEVSDTATADITPGVVHPQDTSVLKATLTGALPGSGIAGGKILAKQVLVLTNPSAKAWAGSVTARMYLCTGDELDDGAVALPGAPVKKINLKPGQHISVPMKFTALPAGMAAGDYHLIVRVTDSDGGFATAVSAGTIAIAPAHIDLSGTFSQVPVTAAAGKPLKATFTLINTGNTTAAGLLPVVVNGSRGRSAGGDLVLAQFDKRIRVAPGKSLRVTFSLPVNASLPNDCYLTVQLDPANTLGDTDPANNAFTSSQPIVIR